MAKHRPLLPIRIRKAAEQMMEELQSARLEVVLVPSRDPGVAERGGMVRAVVERNPKWYRKLCAEYPKLSRQRRNQHSDTVITRRETIRALRAISRTGRFRTVYDERLLPYIVDYLVGAYEEVPF